MTVNMSRTWGKLAKSCASRTVNWVTVKTKTRSKKSSRVETRRTWWSGTGSTRSANQWGIRRRMGAIIDPEFARVERPGHEDSGASEIRAVQGVLAGPKIGRAHV